MLATTFKTYGTSSRLSMSITASPIVSPATITMPSDQQRFTVPDISVSGTCPSDSYVKIYKNGAFNGVSPCTDNKFDFMITLTADANELSVKVFNFSDQEGPVSSGITVYYDAPSPAAPRLVQKPLIRADRLRILTDYKYTVFKSGEPVKLDLALNGGSAPYAVAVYWNDGKITPISRTVISAFTAEHKYDHKTRMYTYVIKVAASDVNGESDYIQLMAVIDGEKPSSSTGTTAAAQPTGKNPGGMQTYLKYLWPAYLIVLLMVLSFYLGEREERRALFSRNKKPLLR